MTDYSAAHYEVFPNCHLLTFRVMLHYIVHTHLSSVSHISRRASLEGNIDNVLIV